MSEHINNTTPCSSGGHIWLWGERKMNNKQWGAVGIDGVAATLLSAGEMPGRITGKKGKGALLKVSEESLAAANAAMTNLEYSLKTLVETGLSYEWEDDIGHTGSNLKVDQYSPRGLRQYGKGAEDAVICWQYYELFVIELDGF